MTSPLPIYDIYVIEYARSKDQPIASLLLGVYDRGNIDLPFSFVMARAEHRVFLDDTGFMREGSGERMAKKFGIEQWIYPIRMLDRLGVAAENVTEIVLTPPSLAILGS